MKNGKANISELFAGIREGKREVIGKALTLVESSLSSDRAYADELLNLCLPFSGNSFRLGISGVPGVGKSTFIENFGLYACGKSKKVCVLAVDPSSKISGGSILGDKTRMQQLAIHPNAFIRPSPSSGNLGGVANATRESIVILEAAGYDFVIVETVGVGQSETEVSEITDFFLLLMLANAGDELQGIKRGIMEICDALYINKADGENITAAKLAEASYANALHLLPPKKNGWTAKTGICSALTGKGLDEIFTVLIGYENITRKNGSFTSRREQQDQRWFEQALINSIFENIAQDADLKKKKEILAREISAKKLNPLEAARRLASQVFKTKKPE